MKAKYKNLFSGFSVNLSALSLRMNGFSRKGGVLLCVLSLLSGCKSPEIWRHEADSVADRTISEFQQKALNRTEPFTIERPADCLRRRLMIDQQLPCYTNRTIATMVDAKPVLLKQVECLQVAARNSKNYQDNKEDVFRTALSLDLERDAYRNTWSGLITSLFTSDHSGEEREDKVKAGFTAKFSKRLKSGATIAGKLGVDIIKLLTLDKSSSYGLLADATITMPLMRGAGKAIVTESLTQAERNVMYSLWSFDRYRRTFAVRIASEYFSVLQVAEEARNSSDNVKRLENNLKRSMELSKSGRLPEMQVDQTRQDLLRARSRLVRARQSAERQLDIFKQTLGLPVDASVKLDESELASLFEEQVDITASTEEKKLPDESALIAIALERRMDLRIAFENVADERRQLMVARDALRAGLEFHASASNQERHYDGTDNTDIQFKKGVYSGGLNLDLPWERTDERNAYREQIIACDKAVRDLEEKEDQVKKEVRDARRSLVDARENYIIQQEAMKLAESRVESTQMFLDAGRADTRDVLEAEEDLVSAKNALIDAIVSFRVSRLQLLNDTGQLDIADEWGLRI